MAWKSEKIMKIFSIKQYLYFLLAGMFVYGCTVPRPAPVESRAVKPQEKPTDFYSNSDRRKEEKNGFYSVQEGDTLFGIALAFGQNWRDISNWNGLANPDKISVGQKLRVKPPSDNFAGAVSIPLENRESGKVEEVVTGKSAIQNNEITLSKVTPDVVSPEDANLNNISPDLSSSLSWIWPANGQIIEQFSESNSKGISIAGVSGEDVYASENGKVVYSGNGLRGYGNLVILKHDEDFITAYAHNQEILVKEGESVNKGQKIAKMGMTDSDRPKLLFELRKGGKPIDPLSFLPIR
jgi:lipoprotein NlpD